MAIVEITAALAGIKTAKDLAKGIISLDSDIAIKQKSQELLGIILDLQGTISEIRESLDSIRQENMHLKQELSQINQWKQEKENYSLHELAPSVFVYRYQPIAETTSQPEHMLCASCYNKDKKSILQLSRKVIAGHYYICHECGSEICDHSKRQPIKQRKRRVVSNGIINRW